MTRLIPALILSSLVSCSAPAGSGTFTIDVSAKQNTNVSVEHWEANLVTSLPALSAGGAAVISGTPAPLDTTTCKNLSFSFIGAPTQGSTVALDLFSPLPDGGRVAGPGHGTLRYREGCNGNSPFPLRSWSSSGGTVTFDTVAPSKLPGAMAPQLEISFSYSGASMVAELDVDGGPSPSTGTFTATGSGSLPLFNPGAGGAGGTGGAGGGSGGTGGGTAGGTGGSGGGAATGWAIVPSGTTNPLYAIWGSATNDVYAGGTGELRHWNGTAWGSSAAVTDSFRGIHGISSTDMWAVGTNGATRRQFSGATWYSVASNTTETLNAVWAASSNDAWAVGANGTVLHSGGGAWTAQTSGTTNTLRGVWGTSTSDVWAVGDQGTIIRWNGSMWASVASGTTGTLTAIWGSAADDIWAVGGNGTILRWSGAAWASVTSGTTNILYAVSGSSAGSVWAAGANGTILQWSGAAWASVNSGTTEELHGIWGTPAAVWTVDTTGTIRRGP